MSHTIITDLGKWDESSVYTLGAKGYNGKGEEFTYVKVDGAQYVREGEGLAVDSNHEAKPATGIYANAIANEDIDTLNLSSGSYKYGWVLTRTLYRHKVELYTSDADDTVYSDELLLPADYGADGDYQGQLIKQIEEIAISGGVDVNATTGAVTKNATGDATAFLSEIFAGDIAVLDTAGTPQYANVLKVTDDETMSVTGFLSAVTDKALAVIRIGAKHTKPNRILADGKVLTEELSIPADEPDSDAYMTHDASSTTTTLVNFDTAKLRVGDVIEHDNETNTIASITDSETIEMESNWTREITASSENRGFKIKVKKVPATVG